MKKPHYKLKRIQHVKKGDVFYDRIYGGHIIAESDAVQEGWYQGQKVWKFMYSRSYNICAHRGWAVEDTYLEVYLGERHGSCNYVN